MIYWCPAFKKYFECAYYRTRMSTDSYATSSASESQEPEIGGEMMVVEGSFKYKSWLWEHFTCVTSGSKREKHPPAKCRTCGKVVNRAGGSASRKTSQDHFFYATINTSGNSIVFSDFVLCCMFHNVCVYVCVVIVAFALPFLDLYYQHCGPRSDRRSDRRSRSWIV